MKSHEANSWLFIIFKKGGLPYMDKLIKIIIIGVLTAITSVLSQNDDGDE